MKTCAIVTLAGIAVSALGQNAGDILFTTKDRVASGGATGDRVGWIDLSNANAVETLFTVPELDSRINRLARAPGTNNFFLGNSPFPPADDRTTGNLWLLSNLFGSVSRSSVINSADVPELIAPNGIQYNADAGRVLWINNAIGTGSGAGDVDDGIFGSAIDGSAFADIFQEPNSGPAPRYNAGVEIKADPLRANSYYVSTLNGGDDTTGPNDPQSGTLWRLDVDTNDITNSSMTLITTFHADDTGLGENLTFVQGLTIDGNGDVIIGDKKTRKVYRLEISNDGLSLDGATELIDFAPIHLNAGLTDAGPGDIEFDPFTGMLVLVEDVDQGNDFNDRISRINLDGTGYEVLVNNIPASDVFIIPAPSALALVGLGGLVAVRRRR